MRRIRWGRKYVFGKSGWGQKWVEAFENIDRDTNRLPRGRKYAKDGAVLEIKIQKKSTIFARVQGTRPTPYKEKISLPLFTEEEKDKIKKVIKLLPDEAYFFEGNNFKDVLLKMYKNLPTSITNKKIIRKQIQKLALTLKKQT